MLELRNVSFGYPGREKLLEGITLTFPQKQITTILGPNGSGKSTLLKISGSLLKPSSGEILLNGENINRMKPREVAAKVAILAQSMHPPEMEVEELVAFGRYPYRKYGQNLTKEDQKRIEEAMAQVGILAYRHRLVSRLSGGERQRAYIAMALAQDTDLIFLDEPTTYLDIHIRFSLMDLIQELNRMGKTIVMVLHDLNLALEYSHKLILMEEGKIVKTGSSEELIASKELDRVFRIKTRIFTEEEKKWVLFTGESGI